MIDASLGVAIVGTGFGQKIHIPGFQIHHRTHVAAVYHRDSQKAQTIATAHQIPHACHSVEQLLALPEVEAVSISTPPFLHYDMAKAALQAGKHVLLEKPVTLNVLEAIELYHLAQSRNLKAIVDFEFRFIPAWQRFAELLAEGYVGQKRLIKVDWLVPSRADATRPWNWYARKDQGGGALGAIGSHFFDYIAWLFAPVKQLCGRLSTTIATRPDPITGEPKPVDADDTCMLMLELADGTPCQANLSAVAYQGRGHWVEVYGEQGTLILGSDNLKDYGHGFKLWASQTGEPLSEVEVPTRLQFPKTYDDGRLAPFVRVIDRWVQSIDHNQTLAPSLQEGVYSQLLMDLTQRSHELAKWVNVPTLEEALQSGGSLGNPLLL